MPLDLSQLGGMMPGGGMPDMMPQPGRPPGMPGQGMPDQALQALDGLQPKSANPTQAVQKIEQAMELAHQLVMTALPQVSQWNPKVAQQMHAAARMLIGIRSDIRKEVPPQPPPDLMLGLGMAGTPGGPIGSMPPGLSRPG